MEFVEKYCRAFHDLGLTLSDKDGISDSTRKFKMDSISVPLALEDYYSVCGLHEINKRHNKLLLPCEIYVIDDRLVFMEEEQGGFVWGVLPSASTDPEVWQGIKVVGDPDLHWYREDLLLSDFIIAMWRWQVTGEEPRRSGPE